jgi:hypothetical protein
LANSFAKYKRRVFDYRHAQQKKACWLGVWHGWHLVKMGVAGTGHGYNDELTKLLSMRRGLNYAREYFRFTLLEYFAMKTDDDLVIGGENYWKDVLFSRVPHEYNKN